MKCGELKIELGAGAPYEVKEPWWRDCSGFIALDQWDYSKEYAKDGKREFYQIDLEENDLPFCTDAAEEIRAIAIFEHLTVKGLIRTMNECHRVLKPGGLLYFHVPHWQSRVMAKDPTHQRTWDDVTFKHFFDKDNYRKEYGFKPWTDIRNGRLQGHNDIHEVYMRPHK